MKSKLEIEYEVLNINTLSETEKKLLQIKKTENKANNNTPTLLLNP